MATTKPASTPKAKPPAKEEKGAPEPVLVFLDSQGPYVANIVRKRSESELPKGAGKDDPIERMSVERVILTPGLCLMDGETWEKCSKNGGFLSRLDDQSILVINDQEGETWESAWNGLRVNRAIELVGHSAHEPTLRALLEKSEKPEVGEAVEGQLREIADDNAERRAIRREKRTANRALLRGRSRTGKLLN